MKADDNTNKENDSSEYESSQEEGRDVCGTSLTLGGPCSAFSGVSPLRPSSYGGADSLRDTSYNMPTDRTSTDKPCLSMCSYFPQSSPSVGVHFDNEMPVAPAFAQIFHRRRRRESRPRRQRTTFTSDQTLKLELEYNRADYITRPRRFELAEMLTLTESQIKIWFQNRRAKDKRIEKAQIDQQFRSMVYPTVVDPYRTPHYYGTYAVPPLPFPFPVPAPLYGGVTPLKMI